jgi:antitoxin HigA-1
MFTVSGGSDLTGNVRMPTASNSRRKNGNSDIETQRLGRPPTAPGEVLREEFLAAHGITQDRLAEAMGVSRFRVNEVINGKRAVTAETALLLAAALGTSPEFWLNLQRAVDLHKGRLQLSSDLKRIKPIIEKKSAKEIFYDISDG